MTISCRCPKCDGLCAFYDKNAGRNARCRKCGQIFIIPARDGARPEKVKIKIEKGEPEPGFYQAVFVKSGKIFVDPANLTSFVFVVAVISFKFFLAGSWCLAELSFIIVWGGLLGFYLNIIYETAFEVDQLPEIYLGTFVSWWWYVLKPFLIFLATLAAVLVPFFVARTVLGSYGIKYTLKTMWVAEFGPATLLQGLFLAGLFAFPMAILTVAVGRDLFMLRPDYLVKPIIKALGPYSITVVILAVACFLELHAKQYGEFKGAKLTVTGAHLLYNLLVQAVAIIAMRTIGLFLRHYSCYVPW